MSTTACASRAGCSSQGWPEPIGGEVDQHSQEPTLAIGELAQIESRAALVHDEPGLVAAFYSEVVELTQEGWECLLDSTVCACGPPVGLFEYGFLAPEQGGLAETQLTVFECLGICGTESPSRPRLARAPLQGKRSMRRVVDGQRCIDDTLLFDDAAAPMLTSDLSGVLATRHCTLAGCAVITILTSYLSGVSTACSRGRPSSSVLGTNSAAFFWETHVAVVPSGSRPTAASARR